jgi:hypothetical protein
MRSPVVAMLWENWRLTRVEAAQRLVQGIVFPAALLGGFAAFGPVGNSTARVALFLLLMTYFPLWLSVCRLNGGRMMDGYRPGYPFYFLFTRPVRTFVLVAAPMACNAALAAALYLVAAFILRAIFGYPFPLMLAAGIAATHVAQWGVQWGTRNKFVQWLGSMAVTIPFAILAVWRLQEWPARFDFWLVDYAVMGSIGVAAFGLAVAGVARQRRGDARAALPRTVEWRGFSDWLADLFRFPCPTASPTRAQLWFDVKSSGLAVLTIGLVLAVAIPVLLVATTRLDILISPIFPGAATRIVPVTLAMFALPAVLLLGGNAFGIRARQGWTYASVFEATQACRTARMAGLKVLVRSACVLTALLAVLAGIWIAASAIPFDVLADNDTFIEKSRSPVSGWMRAIQAGILSMSAAEQLALAFVACTAVALMVAVRASLTALGARYPRRRNIVRSALLSHAFLLVLLWVGAQRGIGSQVVADTTLTATKWTAVAALVLVTIYLLWASLSERLLTPRAAAVVLLSWAAFAAAWVTVLRAGSVQHVLQAMAGVQLAGVPLTDVRMLLPVLLVVMVSILGPWSLSRVRHT